MSQVTLSPTPSQRQRTVRFLKPFDADLENAEIEISITRGNKTETTSYWLDKFPADYGEAYLLEKVGDGSTANEEYFVNLQGADSTCDCPGFCWGQAKSGMGCKHIDALHELKSRNLL